MARTDLWQQVDRDLYAVLGLTPGASADQVQTAWRAAAKIAHPDRGGDESAFRAVHIAYLVLSDPQQRQRYDAARRPAPHAVWESDAPLPRSKTTRPPPSPYERPGLLWLYAIAAVLTVAGSYLWPVLTIITVLVVGVIVLARYHRMGFGLLRRD